jgi:hypothetical protein
MKLCSKPIRKARVTLYIIFPIVLWLLPADFFDHGPEICLSQFILHTSCYGCGISRAMMHLLHFDLQAAMAYNKLSLIVLPLLIVIWFQDLRRDIRYLYSVHIPLKTTKAA